jgi:hypothetical protein
VNDGGEWLALHDFGRIGVEMAMLDTRDRLVSARRNGDLVECGLKKKRHEAGGLGHVVAIRPPQRLEERLLFDVYAVG